MSKASTARLHMTDRRMRDIVKAVLTAYDEKHLPGLLAAEQAAGDKVYAATGIDEKKMPAAIRGLLPRSSHFFFIENDGEKISFTSPRIVPGDRDVLVDMLRSYKARRALVTHRKAVRATRAHRKEYAKLKSRTFALLNPFKTIGAALKEYPELEAFLPESVATKTRLQKLAELGRNVREAKADRIGALKAAMEVK